MATPDDKSEVKYCVTAVLDLLGFAAHLEIGSNDLRTRIGSEAITRLQTLNTALTLLKKEQETCSQEYSVEFNNNLRFVRINDAIILTIDLPDLLRPSVGETAKMGHSWNEIEELCGTGLTEMTEEDFLKKYWQKVEDLMSDLIAFVGLVARIHSYINATENKHFFPGAKTVVATGYRRVSEPLQAQHFLDANFSFSNAFLAGKDLHGPRLFVDDNVCRLLTVNRFSRNLLRLACFAYRQRFDPFRESSEPLRSPSEIIGTETTVVNFFRKPFTFRELNPSPLEFLQILPRVRPCLEGNKEGPENVFIKAILKHIKNPSDLVDGLPKNISFHFANDMGHDIRIISEFIETGKSAIFDEIRQKQSYLYSGSITKKSAKNCEPK